jgi:hypothetical protein
MGRRFDTNTNDVIARSVLKLLTLVLEDQVDVGAMTSSLHRMPEVANLMVLANHMTARKGDLAAAPA